MRGSRISTTDNLTTLVDQHADDDGHVAIQRVAQIISEHKNWTDRAARKSLIGALARQQANAFTKRSWHWVHDFGSTDEREEIIKPQFWNANHVDHRPTIDGRLATTDAMDWETGTMRLWRHVITAALPYEIHNLVVGLGASQIVHWEYFAQQITICEQDVIRLVTDTKLHRYGAWLDENPPNKPGIPNKRDWDRTKAYLIVEACYNPQSFLEMATSKAALSHYVTEKYSWLSADATEPFRKDLAEFVDILLEQLQLRAPPP